MKSLKNLLSLMLLPFLLLLSACQGDPCDDVTCPENASCFEGNCSCNQNYSGEECEIYTDPCTLVNCTAPNTSCEEGDCVCDAGYTDTSCETVIRLDLLGAYTVDDSCDPNTTFSAQVRAGGNVDQIEITNLHNHFNWYPWQLNGESTKVLATVTAEGISFSDETFPAQGLERFRTSGTGTYTSDGFSLSYSVTDTSDGTVYSCSATYTKE